jgi:hypothetical protein
VAVLALDIVVDVFFMKLQDIFMAVPAYFLSQMHGSPVHELEEAVNPVMACFPEAFGQKQPLDAERCNCGDNQEKKDSPDMGDVIHQSTPCKNGIPLFYLSRAKQAG